MVQAVSEEKETVSSMHFRGVFHRVVFPALFVVFLFVIPAFVVSVNIAHCISHHVDFGNVNLEIPSQKGEISTFERNTTEKEKGFVSGTSGEFGWTWRMSLGKVTHLLLVLLFLLAMFVTTIRYSCEEKGDKHEA